jgi:hypothetical protein
MPPDGLHGLTLQEISCSKSFILKFLTSHKIALTDRRLSRHPRSRWSVAGACYAVSRAIKRDREG